MHKTLSYYENNAKHLSQRYESAKVDHIHVLLLKTFSSNSYLLEIGCESGRDAGFMQLDKSAIDQTIEKIATILKAGSKFFFSVSIDGLDREGIVWLTCVVRKSNGIKFTFIFSLKNRASFLFSK